MNNWLNDLRVIDMGRSPAVKYCGRVMAQLGAQVLDVSEHASGQLNARTLEFLQQGKQPVAARTLNELRECSGCERFDIVIGDPGCDFDAFDCDPAHPMLRGIVDPFGPSGPWADWQGSEMVFATLGGASGYTLSESGMPVYGVGHRYQFLAGLYLYTALMALAHRCSQVPDLPVRERLVRVSAYETVVATMPYLPVQYFYNRSNRIDNHTGPRLVVRCKDGWIMSYLGAVWRSAAGLIDRLDLLDDPRFQSTASQFEHIAALEALVREWGAGKTVAQTIEAARKWDIAVTEIVSTDVVFSQIADGHSGQWVHRDGGVQPAFPVVMKHNGMEAAHD